MEEVRRREKKILIPRASLVRKAWVNIILLLLAGLMIGSGVYFNSQPEWIKRADIRMYNKGVIAYVATSPGLLPASKERPSEYPIERAAGYFQEVASKSTDNKLKSLALYNLGTLIARESYALSSLAPKVEMETALPQAIMRLAEAIRIDPNNEDAKYNLELLEKISGPLEGQKGGPGPGYAPGTAEKGY